MTDPAGEPTLAALREAAREVVRFYGTDRTWSLMYRTLLGSRIDDLDAALAAADKPTPEPAPEAEPAPEWLGVDVGDAVRDLPERVVVGANGAYWRDYGDAYSMCPVSTDNDPVVPMAIYQRVPEPYGWHADGDLCLGSECLNIDEATGDHSTDVHSDDWWEGFAEAGRRAATLDAARAEPALPDERPTRQEHVRTPEGPDDYCTGCGELWPCSFEQGWLARGSAGAGLDTKLLAEALTAHRGDAHTDGEDYESARSIAAEYARLAAALASPAAPEPREGLDVERLARAIHEAAVKASGKPIEPHYGPFGCAWLAEVVATEYAAAPTPEPADRLEGEP